MKLSEALLKAEHAIGTLEYPHPPYPANHTDFATAVDLAWPLGFTRQNQQWCGTFVEWVLGKDMLPGPTYTVTTGIGYFKQAGRWATVPEPGYVCYMTFRPDRVASHVGLVKHVVNSTLVDNIEGNTQAGVSGVQDNGGGVFQRTRQTPIILGYGVVQYDPEGAPEMPYKLLKSTFYANVFAFFPSGIVRGCYGLKEFNEFRALSVPFDESASKEDIERAALLAGPGSGVLVPA